LRKISIRSVSPAASENLFTLTATVVVTGVVPATMFTAAGSSVGASTVPVDVNAAPAIVPFQIPTASTAVPPVAAPTTSVVTVKFHLPVGKPVEPLFAPKSASQPLPSTAGAAAVVFAAPGLNWK